MKYIPYVAAMTEPRLSEAELMPKKNWYPNHKKKERAILRESKANDRTSFPDQVCGVLNPIVYALNKGETVLTPFMGVGSEVYSPVSLGRKAIGIELKESYFKQAKLNLEACKNRFVENTQLSIV